MIKTITLENVRVYDHKVIELGHMTKVYGPNGRGKSTVRDAIAFVYTGADSYGNPAPTHLIREGENKMKVTLDLGRSTLERSLTRKKSATLKLIRPDHPPLPLTQEQLSGMLGCSKDVFLSGFCGGYFTSMKKEKRLEVLRDFIPKMDKHAILEEILGAPLTNDMKIALPLETKRTDIVASSIAGMRLHAEKTISNLEGRKEVHKATPEPGERPQVSDDELRSLKSKKEVWDLHESRHALWKKAKAQVASYEDRKAEWEVELERLKKERAAIRVPEMPDLPDRSKDLKELLAQVKETPPAPLLAGVPDSDRCPTCSQVVGAKHRESIYALNQQTLKEAEQKKAEILHHNKKIKEQVEWIKAQDARDEDVRKRVSREISDAQRQQAGIDHRIRLHTENAPHVPQTPGQEPQPPVFSKVDVNTFEKAERAYQDARDALSRWNQKSEAYNRAQSELARIDQEIEKATATVEQYSAVEAALKKLDAEIFRRGEEFYKFSREGFRFEITEDGDVAVMTPWGPYTAISTGQKILTDAYICEKIAKSMKKPLKFIFVDDTDLVSEPVELDVEQVILTEVTNAVGVVVENYKTGGLGG